MWVAKPWEGSLCEVANGNIVPTFRSVNDPESSATEPLGLSGLLRAGAGQVCTLGVVLWTVHEGLHAHKIHTSQRQD